MVLSKLASVPIFKEVAIQEDGLTFVPCGDAARSAPSRHVMTLDGLRGFAIVLVLRYDTWLVYGKELTLSLTRAMWSLQPIVRKTF